MKGLCNFFSRLDSKKWILRCLCIGICVLILGGAGILLSANGEWGNIRAAAETSQAEKYQAWEQYFNEYSSENYDEDVVLYYLSNAEEYDDWEIEDLFYALPTVTKVLTVITGIALVILGICYWLLVALWLYQASGRVGMNQVFWGILGLAGNVLAVVVFLILRNRKTYCPNCKTWQDDAAFCRECGAVIHPVCNKCGCVLNGRDRFCPDCGEKISDKE